MKNYKRFSFHHLQAIEDYLRHMHQAGYALKTITMMGKLTFEPCQPEDVVYRFDLQKQAYMDLNKSYVQTYRDAGWQLVPLDYQGVVLFKKSAEGVASLDELELYSDSHSRYAFEKLLLQRRLAFPLIPLLLPITQTFTYFFDGAPKRSIGFWLFWGLIFLEGLVWCLYYLKQFRDLKKKYSL
ncbi:DUF2812 domain-containing protein [Streptococcus saliviloxodontae]|uniref:DUF2812 domain-containing protein n=1 Tax=Streptococcus saliviloxodontae TaxID=1349416 RepID=A0ABS2PKH3_9STRE|nr:DUF2812 domain-containing protein [Streptococcus saliviloxodontae]MBM7635933.1 hypothetical protein [Streptococcus saliviloxodontae]